MCHTEGVRDKTGFYLGRAIGGYCDHWHPGGVAAAGDPGCAGGGAANGLHQPAPADRHCLAQLPRFKEAVPAAWQLSHPFE